MVEVGKIVSCKGKDVGQGDEIGWDLIDNKLIVSFHGPKRADDIAQALPWQPLMANKEDSSLLSPRSQRYRIIEYMAKTWYFSENLRLRERERGFSDIKCLTYHHRTTSRSQISNLENPQHTASAQLVPLTWPLQTVPSGQNRPYLGLAPKPCILGLPS